MKRLGFLFISLLVFGLGCIPAALAPPVIVAFSVSPTEIAAGESATLLWNVTGATSVNIDHGVGDVSAADTAVVSPVKTTAYTLTATNNAGTVSKSVVLTISAVSPPPGAFPVIAAFVADPPEITVGSSTTLRWKVIKATSVSIDQGVGDVPADGMIVVSPTATTSYTLTATNEAGSVTATIQVVVSGMPAEGLPVLNYFTASPAIIGIGDSSVLSWNVSNATTVIISPGVGSVAMSGSLSVWPAVTTVYSLTATNAVGSVSALTQVTVSAAPPVTFAVTKVQAKGASASGTRPCPFTISYTFDITTNGAGTVTYHFERSDGATSPTYALNFTSASTKTVSFTWTVPISGTYWVRCRTLTPNDMSANSVPVTVTCQ